jgi:hypothetical protein
MRLLVRRAGFFTFTALTLTAGTLPVWSAGCGNRSACFVYSQGEYAAAHNACPAQAKALPFFTDPHCAGPVVSVDGEGSFTLNDTNPDQSLCCYPVTQQDISADALSGDCMPPGVGGAGAGGFGVGGATTFDVATTVGVGGMPGGCFNNCNVLLQGGDQKFVCGGAANVWASLLDCVCNATSTCVKVCQLNICSGHPMTKDCLACLDDPMSSCTMELAACQAD